MNFCDLSNDELWLVIRLYFFALAPILLSFYYLKQKNISTATAFTLLVSFFIAAIGWEIWITYGLWDGLSVNERRSEALNCAVPQNLNWILNSLGDLFVVWIGLFLLKIWFKNSDSHLRKWNWTAFIILFSWFLLQNIYVEAFFYNQQLGSNGDLSWAPLNPMGSYYNPILFKIMERPITFQTQSTWILMSPTVYWLIIYFNNKFINSK